MEAEVTQGSSHRPERPLSRSPASAVMGERRKGEQPQPDPGRDSETRAGDARDLDQTGSAELSSTLPEATAA